MNIDLFKKVPVWGVAVLFMACQPQGTHLHEEEKVMDHEEDLHTQEADAHTHGEDEIVLLPEQAKAAGIQTEKIQYGPFQEVIHVTGSILPAQGGEATVSATHTGMVNLANYSLNEGSEVHSGQALFTIATQAVGDGNPVAAAKAELAAAEKEWKRAQQLIVDKIISEREYEAARLRYETALSTSKSWGDGKRQQTVKAPIHGYLQNLLVKNGDFVAPGQPLATITQNRQLQLRAEVPEKYYASLNDIVSANFRLSYDAQVYQLEELQGRLLSSGRTVNKGEGFLPVTFEFSNRGNIIPGSLAEVYLLGRTQPHVISIPVSALTEELGLFYVYLQTSDHGYEKQEVKLGASNGTHVEIRQGLHEGEVLVVQGAVAVKLAANSNQVPDAHAGHNH